MEKQKTEANKLNESAIEYSLLKRDLETNRTLYEGLLEKLKEAGVAAGLRSNNFRLVDAARKPTAPTEPNIPRNLSFALALGLTAGVGLAFVLEALDNTVCTPEQAQAISALPSLGMIPLGSLIGEVGAPRLAGDLERSSGTGDASTPAVTNGGILSRFTNFTVAHLPRDSSEGHSCDQRTPSGRQNHDQHEYCNCAGAKG
jgi:hypothetical protein